MGTSTEQHYSLRWNDYTVKIVTAFQSLRDEEDFVDVTVACDGHHYTAHKMVLSACSPYFRSLLRANPCQHPIVILKDVGHLEMERLLEFMYNGEVNIAQDQLAAFLKTAESLKIRGLAGSSDELDQTQGRDGTHNYTSCLSGATGTIGGISGRNSPSASYNSGQDGGKDDDITTDGIFHTNSPSTKRRKRASDAPPVSQAENSSSQTTDNLTGDGLMESGGDRVNMSGDPSIEMEDDRMDRRELKSEPSEAIGVEYVESEMATDQNQHSEGIDHRHITYPLALAGPSGSSSLNNQDGLTSGENAATAAARHSAVCEALNLSIRQTPATIQLNGNAVTPNSLPTSVSIHGPAIQRSAYQPQPLFQHTPSNSITLVAPQFKCEVPDYEENNSEFLESGVLGESGATTSDHLVYHHCDSAIDLVCATDKKPFCENDFDPLAQGGGIENAVGNAQSSTPMYKTKVYPCPECLKVFRHPMSLHHHRHVHKGTYTCQSCGKVFSRRWDLHRHIHRSKMGCRRSTNHSSPAITDPRGLTAVTGMRSDCSFHLNNSPSN